MAPLSWMSLQLTEDHVLLQDHRPDFSHVPGVNQGDYPSLVTFIGDRTKSANLAALCAHPKPYKRHRTARLVRGSSKVVDSPEIYVDCELQLAGSLSEFEPAADTYKANWFCTGDRGSAAFPAYVIGNVVTPLSSVLCIFADDFGGFPGVASFLASQVVLPTAHSLPASTLPHVLVVVNASSTTYDNSSASETLLAQILQHIAAEKTYSDASTARRDIGQKYRVINVHGFAAKLSARQRTADLKAKLASLQSEVYWARRIGRYHFNAEHLTEFSRRMISKLGTDGALFDFLHHSRTKQFETSQISTHLTGLLNSMPGQHWLWRVVIPLMASAFFMASYPPNSHQFPPEDVYLEFFAAPCQQALNQYTRDVNVRSRAISSIMSRLEEQFRQLEIDPSGQSALNQHRHLLETLWPHLSEMKSNRSCLSCLMFMPEKVFQCGHAICDVCIRRFGVSTTTAKHNFTLPCCVLCGCEQPKDCRVFKLVPPTAGIRTLCIDGGGVRGVIPLTFLKHLEDEINGLGGVISECFDYICGTSAGGLIALGIFLMQWSPSECLRRFEEMATTTFRVEDPNESLTWSQKLQRLFRVCLQDHRYNLTPIEKVFQTKSGSTTKMFNPLQSDTKVAVTTTSVRENVAGVISNYNYGPRLDASTYHHIRAAQPQHDMTVSEAAACTSAAPFFFKSKDVVQLDTFQDGGLRHNNPAWLAVWECETIWPEKFHVFGNESSGVRLDHFISLGTGTTAPSTYQLGPHSPKLDRFFKRLRSSFEHQLNNEEQWNTFIRCVPAKLRSRCLRLNVPLPGGEPALDDVTAITQLKSAASKSVETDATIAKVKNSLFASLFYLEVDNYSQMIDATYKASVTVYCRLPLDFAERKRFYHTLLRKHAMFVINGRAHPCVSSLPSGFPMYRCSFDLRLKSKTDDINVRLSGITSEPTLISGMPTRLDWLIAAQSLESPFGTIEGYYAEKALPNTPLKRKAAGIV